MLKRPGLPWNTRQQKALAARRGNVSQKSRHQGLDGEKLSNFPLKQAFECHFAEKSDTGSSVYWLPLMHMISYRGRSLFLRLPSRAKGLEAGGSLGAFGFGSQMCSLQHGKSRSECEMISAPLPPSPTARSKSQWIIQKTGETNLTCVCQR